MAGLNSAQKVALANSRILTPDEVDRLLAAQMGAEQYMPPELRRGQQGVRPGMVLFACLLRTCKSLYAERERGKLLHDVVGKTES